MIKVHARPSAVVKMDAIMANYPFAGDRIKKAASDFVERYRNRRANSLGHTVGMEVHGLRNPTGMLEPRDFHHRTRDADLMNASGYENLSVFVPVETGAIGLSDAMMKPAH